MGGMFRTGGEEKRWGLCGRGRSGRVRRWIEDEESQRKGERTMKKDFGVKTWLLPMPVLMIATYGEDGTPNAMNAAWGGTGGDELLTVCIDNTHKTWANLEKRRAFTVSVGTEGQMKTCDHLGCVSGYKEPDKVAKAGWTVEKSPHVDAPRINELPLAFECEVVSMDPETCLVVGKVVNVAADESVLTDGKPDTEKVRPLTYDPLQHVYRGLTSPLGKAFQG